MPPTSGRFCWLPAVVRRRASDRDASDRDASDRDGEQPPSSSCTTICTPAMMRTGRNAMRLAGIDARNGAPERRFDAYPWRHPVTESSYINRLANRPYRSTIKTLPATLPGPWTTVRWPGSRHIGPWSTDLEPRIVDSVSRFKLRGSRLVDAGPGLLGVFARSRSNWVEGEA